MAKEAKRMPFNWREYINQDNQGGMSMNSTKLLVQPWQRLADEFAKLTEESTMNKTRFDEIFDLLAELEMRLFYVKNDPGEMPIIEVAEVHEKVKAALVEWNHLASFAEEG